MSLIRTTTCESATTVDADPASCPMSTLDELAIGACACIVSLCDRDGRVCEPGAGDETAIRMQHLGFVPGCVVRIVSKGFLGRGGVAVQANSTRFGLNRAEAARIQTTPVATAATA